MGKETFVNNLSEVGIIPESRQLEAFDEYYRMLVEWNEFMNLTGITEYDEVLLKHYVDSVAINTVLSSDSKWNLGKNLKVIDVGTGAGFPGLPLKIAFENLDITLLDSLNKRIKFLDAVIEKLELKDIKTIHGRAEDFARDPEYREQFDLCVSRAVSNLATLAEYCLPYVKTGGAFISYKSGEIEEEIESSSKAIHLLGGKIVEVRKMTLPGSDIERSFVIIEKIRNTAKTYPRKAGLPAKEPLK